ncbi:hypothetical protein [Mucilaginibacter myungsuensis]|uniref:hypothetical protein n=1 Tax=Mucilaginibacter myungsuensis TaxID=649104 RepID=UPI001D16D0E3|nr:hypothetical protein [Mucilaginibacter myungsuensis]MDN3599924.1 hypothetical protein [Mucilaginibacter myungsuensis]
MSGRFDLTRPVLYFRDLLDGFHNDEVYFNMPRQYMANIADGQHLDQIRQMDIVMTIGETDPFFQDNYEFSEILGWKGMQHQFHKWTGYAHSPKSWRKMVQLYL